MQAKLLSTMALSVVPFLVAQDLLAEWHNTTTLISTGYFSKNPDFPFLYPDPSDAGHRLEVRESVRGSFLDHGDADIEAIGLLSGGSSKISPAYAIVSTSDEGFRSSRGEVHWHSGPRVDGYWILNRARLGWTWSGGNVSIGRFPIQLATTLIMAPNDFFAPVNQLVVSQPTKPGVDALEVSHDISNVATLSALAIAGYRRRSLFGRGSAIQEESTFSTPDSALLIRGQLEGDRGNGSLFFGKLGRSHILGGGWTGALDEVGLRGEGHVLRSTEGDRDLDVVVALGADHRPLEALYLNAEVQGRNKRTTDSQGNSEEISGTTDEEEDLGTAQPEFVGPLPRLLGPAYFALGGDLELETDWRLKTVLIADLHEHAFAWTTTSVWSVSENCDLSLRWIRMSGPGFKDFKARSTFGAAPDMALIEAAMVW